MKIFICLSSLILAASTLHIERLEDEKVDFINIMKSKHIKSPKTKPMDDPLWREYKLKFGKFYKTEEEEAKRYLIWKEHLADIQTHNSNSAHTYKKGLNHFHDLVSKKVP